jgi:hypothetical protein
MELKAVLLWVGLSALAGLARVRKQRFVTTSGRQRKPQKVGGCGWSPNAAVYCDRDGRHYQFRCRLER